MSMRPETGNALLGDAFCFSLRHAKTFLDVSFLGHISAAIWV